MELKKINTATLLFLYSPRLLHPSPFCKFSPSWEALWQCNKLYRLAISEKMRQFVGYRFIQRIINIMLACFNYLCLSQLRVFDIPVSYVLNRTEIRRVYHVNVNVYFRNAILLLFRNSRVREEWIVVLLLGGLLLLFASGICKQSLVSKSVESEVTREAPSLTCSQF